MSEDPVRAKVRLYVADVTPERLPPFAGVRVRRHRRRVRESLAVAVTVLLVLGVATAAALSRRSAALQTATGGHLVGPTWRLVSLTSKGTAVAGEGAYLTFTPTSYKGYDGCRWIQGGLQVADSSFAGVGGQAGTDNACPAKQAFTDSFDTLVQEPTTRFAVDGATLTLSGASASGVFTSAAPAATPSRPTSLEPGLVGPTWKLVLLSAPGVQWRPLAGSTASLTLTRSGFSVSDGCNSRGGAVAFDATGTGLTFGGGSSSGGACSFIAPGPPAGTFAPAIYLAFFNGRATAALDGTTLTLTAGGAALTFSDGGGANPSAVPAPTAASLSATGSPQTVASRLVGPTWLLESWTRDGATTPAPADRRPTVVLGDAVVMADDGCNGHSGAVTYAGATIRPGPMGETDVACTGVSGEIGKVVDRLFDHDVSAALAGSTLTLSGSGVTFTLLQGPAATFTAAPHNASSLCCSQLQRALEGVDWQLSSDGQDSVGARHARLWFDRGSYYFDDGCAIERGLMTYGSLWLTMTDQGALGGSCADDGTGPRALTDHFDAVRAGRPVFTLGPGSVLTVANGPSSLVFHGSSPVTAPPTALQAAVVGHSWQLVSTLLGGSTSADPAGMGMTLDLSATQFSITSGGGRIAGYAGYRGATLTLRDVVGPQAGCQDPDLIDTVAAVGHVLYAGAQATLAGDMLTLAGNNAQLVFHRGALSTGGPFALPDLPQG